MTNVREDVVGMLIISTGDGIPARELGRFEMNRIEDAKYSDGLEEVKSEPSEITPSLVLR